MSHSPLGNFSSEVLGVNVTDVASLCGVIVKDYDGSCVLCDVIIVVNHVFIF